MYVEYDEPTTEFVRREPPTPRMLKYVRRDEYGHFIYGWRKVRKSGYVSVDGVLLGGKELLPYAGQYISLSVNNDGAVEMACSDSTGKYLGVFDSREEPEAED